MWSFECTLLGFKWFLPPRKYFFPLDSSFFCPWTVSCFFPRTDAFCCPEFTFGCGTESVVLDHEKELKQIKD